MSGFREYGRAFGIKAFLGWRNSGERVLNASELAQRCCGDVFDSKAVATQNHTTKFGQRAECGI